MRKNRAAVLLGKKSWKKRNSPAEYARLKEIGRLGGLAKAAKLDKRSVESPNNAIPS